ncbi:MAG: hypothetical protein Q7K13_01450 [Polynucleobacter sp.]|uniref:hypothetical protein n=1 Tax=Polynucleobacter sp. TaxID=2029855 RepID=UPI0027227346|nr:hypothetical protein [Polynucleobacter sp.]MDO8713136.1 hypothetical protein [Polynucleobacter sp.]
MGYSFKGICHTLKTSADTQFCESLTSSGMQSNGDFMSQTCASITETTATITKIINATTTSQTVALPTYLACDYDGGLSLSQDYFGKGMVLLGCLWALKYLNTLFRGKSEHA